MSSILIRQLDEETKSRLRVRAARKGHSMEQEARDILKRTLVSEGPARVHLVDAIRRRIQPLGGVDLPVIPRGPIPKPPVLAK
jgi:plasmid stability protein